MWWNAVGLSMIYHLESLKDGVEKYCILMIVLLPKYLLPLPIINWF